jgi:PAS domain S-box-containing protein
MAFRRFATLIRMLSGDLAFKPDPTAEFAALLISILMVVGVAKIAPIFLFTTRVEKELNRSKQMLEDIAQGITDTVMLLSKDFKILWANKAALRQTGLSMEELMGNYCYKATHQREYPCEPPDNTCPVFELLETGHPEVTEHTHYDRNGNRFFVEVSVYPIKNEVVASTRRQGLRRDRRERRSSEKG